MDRVKLKRHLGKLINNNAVLELLTEIPLNHMPMHISTVNIIDIVLFSLITRKFAFLIISFPHRPACFAIFLKLQKIVNFIRIS